MSRIDDLAEARRLDTTPSTNIQEAQNALEKAKKLALTQCELEIKAVLEKHKCALHTVQEYVNGKPGEMRIVVGLKG